MLNHGHAQPVKPSRVVVLGGGGFIAGAILRRLQADGITVLGLGRAGLDLLAAGAADRLAQVLEAKDTLVFASARAPCKDLQMLVENTQIAEVVCAALKHKPVAHVVYISSDAVYKDSPGPLTETSCAEPGALHGVMHLTREVALRQGYAGPLAIVRPTLVYGFDDPHNGYGPNRFRRLAAAGKEIVLFGEGEERRDHVDVEDVAELVRLIVVHRSAGIANAVSGEVATFRELAEFAAAAFTPKVAVKSSPRTGPMPHNGYRPFDNSAVLKAFPGFRFKSWRKGLAAVHARQQQERSESGK
ncbi:MAG: SDR family oxidoreductase [Burkholderiales bacterium]|nr:SDR family oxidoreductase [Burkholderiales bacterium]